MLEIVAQDVLVGIVVARAEGKLTAADYKGFQDEIDRMVALQGPVDLIVDLRAVEGFSVTGAVADLTFDATHQNSLRHVAIVGDARWQEAGTELSMPFLKPEARYFDSVEEARGWLSEVRDGASDSE